MELGKRVNLKDFSNFNIGGPALDFVRVHDFGELVDTVKTAKQIALPTFVLGGGTNILWGDDGYPGIVVQPALRHMEFENRRLSAGAGVHMPNLVSATVSRGMAGVEWAGGLPGSFGGAIFGNAGCFGGEVKDIIEEVVSMDMDTLEIKRRNCEECEFGYRTSVFKTSNRPEVIIEATINLVPGNKVFLNRSVEDKIRYRKAKHPLEYPNIGSIFKNVEVKGLPDSIVDPHRHVIKIDPFPVIPAAYLIDKARLKGLNIGGAVVSPKHPNFIINAHNAKARDVLELISLVKEKVKDNFGIELQEEVLIMK